MFKKCGPNDVANGMSVASRPRDTVMRELWEETGISHAEMLGETDWMTYEFPDYDGPPHRFSQFRGQRQKWFALRFTGDDGEIDIASPGGHKPEFDAWRWERMERLPQLIIPFKRPVYEKVVAEFARFAAP